MAYQILSNKKNNAATIHVSGANTTIVVAGNNSVSNVAISNEILTGGAITQVYWGVDAGSIQVLRGANLVATFVQSGHLDYAGSGLSLTKDSTANLVVNFVGTANGYLLVEVQKSGTFTSEYMQN